MSVFDPGVIAEDSPISDDDGSRGPEGEMGSGDGVPEGNRLAEQGRKLDELSSQVESVLFDNAQLRAERDSLKANAVRESDPAPKVFSKEELKAHAMQEEGKLQYDASVVYTDQKFTSFKEQFTEEMRQNAANEAVSQRLSRIAPGIQDPKSELSQKIAARRDQIVLETPALGGSAMGMQRAYELALLETVGSTPGVPASGDSSPEAFGQRRRLESSAASGVGGRGTGGDGGGSMSGFTSELTEEHLQKARDTGSTMIDDPDPIRRKAARSTLLKLIQKRDEMGLYQGGPFSGSLAQRRSMSGGAR